MNFSGISSQHISGKFLRRLLRVVPPNLTVPIMQGPLRGKKWVVGSSNHGCWLGSYEFEKQQLITKNLCNGDVFYDLGAHVGFYTLLAATKVGAAGCVYAFEPVPRNLTYLRRHIELNQFGNITVYDVAVSDTEETLDFQTNTSSSMGKLVPSGDLQVKTVSLNYLLKQNNLRPPNLMKIDIEGAEYAALKGSTELLQNYPIKLFLAVHSLQLQEQCTHLLQDLGYKVESLRDRQGEITDELFCYKP